MRIFGNKRGVYIATGALLTTLVVTSGSLLTYFLITPEIEKGVDRNSLDVVRNALRGLDTHIRELLAKSTNSASIFKMTLPKGTITANPQTDTLTFSVKTQVDYDPGSTSTLMVAKTDNDILSIESQLPVDLVTRYTTIKPGDYIITLTFEKEVRIRMANWTLHKNTTFTGTVSSTTSNYYLSSLSESAYGFDLNRDGDRNDTWLLYMSDPNEDYVFDTVAIHESWGDLIATLEEGDSFRLGGIPLMVYRVRERYVVFRYARIRMEVR